MKTITFYLFNGGTYKEIPLNEKTLKDCHGMKIKCILLDGSERVGYANPYYSFENRNIVDIDAACDLEYITLETFKNLDDNTHTFTGEKENLFDINREAVPISLIDHIDAILYSGLRWGASPTNKFNLKTDI